MDAHIDCVVVTTTVDDEAKAKELAHLLVENRLAACVQITPIHSVYRWNGKVESAAERLLAAKTTAERADDLQMFIREHHSYELPEIVVLPIHGGHPDYLEWIAEGVNPED